MNGAPPSPLRGAHWPPGYLASPQPSPAWRLVGRTACWALVLAVYGVLVVALAATFLAPEDCPVDVAVLHPEACAPYEKTQQYWSDHGY